MIKKLALALCLPGFFALACEQEPPQEAPPQDSKKNSAIESVKIEPGD